MVSHKTSSSKLKDILLLHADYRTNSPYIGSSVGRVANRIREATFSLDGQTYTVSRNVSPHTLHGGETGFNKANWVVSSTTENSVTFKHVSISGDMGYPGTLEATATYTLADSGEVGVAYTATADQPTIVNLVNHTYFNLTQEVSQSVQVLEWVCYCLLNSLGYHSWSHPHHRCSEVHAP